MSAAPNHFECTGAAEPGSAADEITALRLENAAQRALIGSLQARIAELERRLGLDSSTSSKPPSSDGLKKKPRRVMSLRKASGKKPGGQKGHPGATLRQVERPDIVVDHYPPACRDCGTALTPVMASIHVVRQVFDLPAPVPLVVTEHRAHGCDCAQCGVRTQAAFPADVKAPVQYSARITAFVVYLLHAQFLPQDRLIQMMKDLFGVHMAASTIARMSRDSAERLMPFVAVVAALVAGAPVKHLDETGFRICGKGHWLHVASTNLLTFYRLCSQRGSMMKDLVGVIVHDHWKPYYTIPDVLHALCNGHHLRELKALIEIEKEDWARKMQTLLRRACHATNLAKRQDKKLKPGLVALFQRRYDKIVSEGLAFHQGLAPLTPAPTEGTAKRRGRKKLRIGHNLLNRLDRRKEDVVRFLYHPGVPFTNNQAEQDGRMMKVKQKISGGFRSQQGAEDFAIHRSLLSTAQKHGWNLLDTLASDVQEIIKKIRSA